jgi:hypothetical protein
MIMASAVPEAGQACSIVPPPNYEGSDKQWRDVRSAVENASAIIDGEVIRTWSPQHSAVVRVHHVLKGKVTEYIEVGGKGAGADCSIALERMGERSRMILSNGPAPYDLFRDQTEARLEDRFLKSDRRKIWPYYAGQPAEPIQGQSE